MPRDAEARIVNLELELRALLRRVAVAEAAAQRALETASVRTPDYGGYLAQAVYPARTGGGGVAAKSGGTAGSASVTLYEINPSGGAVSSGATVTAWNYFATAVGASKDVYLGWYVNASGVGMWVVISEAC